jgi:O-antigen ligase
METRAGSSRSSASSRDAPPLSAADPRLEAGLRWALLLLLVAAPLALGSVHPPAYIALLTLSLGLAALSSVFTRQRLSRGALVPRLPCRGLILALLGLVSFQLVPLPPAVLAVLSPGTLRFHAELALIPDRAWHPISVNPADTARGLAFAIALVALYAAVFRELGDGVWRRRLGRVVVLTGCAMALEALVQAQVSSGRIYGLYHPDADWAIFGPYVNRNHFAGYMVMAIPLALAFTAEAVRDFRIALGRRRRGWLAIGDPEGSWCVRRGAEAVVLVVGLVASRSRGGLLAFLVSLAMLPLAFGRLRKAALPVGLVLLVALGFADLRPIQQGFLTRGVQNSRLVLWGDVLPMVRSFPLFGTGMNAFGTAYPRHQHVLKSEWIGQAHNEYLQALTDTGLIGAVLFLTLLFSVLRGAWQTAAASPFDAGVLGSLLALAVHNVVDFNWQIPANAATYVALAALAHRQAARRLDPHGPDA